MRNLLRLIKYLPMRLKYKLLNYKIGKQFVIGKNVNIEKLGFIARDYIYIGQNSYIGPYTELGNFCMISDSVNIIGKDHDFMKVGIPTIFAGRPIYEQSTIIEDDVWIGHGVTIMRGVKIGEGSIIAANSVVTKDIEPYSINAGIPSIKIKMRFESISLVQKHKQLLEEYRRNKNIKIFHKDSSYEK